MFPTMCTITDVRKYVIIITIFGPDVSGALEEAAGTEPDDDNRWER